MINNNLFNEEDEGKGLTGWLSPSGLFLPCSYREHAILAHRIMFNKRYNRQYKLVPEDQLRLFNWVSMTSNNNPDLSSYIFIPTLPYQFTDDQLFWLYNNYYKLDQRQKDYLNEFGELAGWDIKKIKYI